MTLRTPDPARLTPAAVRAMSFRVARLGRRGLDEDDVQDFCEHVEDELARLLEERARLYAEVRRLRGRRPARDRAVAAPAPALPLGAPVAAPASERPPGRELSAGRELPLGRPGPRAPNEQAVRILAQAQQTAERCVADARAYSREVAHDAQRRRERILAEANARAAVLLEQAHRAATRAALGRPAPPPAQLTRPEHRGPAGDERVPATGYSRPSADPRLAADYPGPASDYPGNPARYREAGGRRRIPVKYDRFPF